MNAFIIWPWQHPRHGLIIRLGRYELKLGGRRG